MDLRQISYFVALFEEGSVTRAAQRMNVVQPALSMQIAKLERELDQRLFERQPKAMVPTAAGRLLHRLVQPILSDVAEARATMAQLSQSVSGRVTAGILSSLSMSVVPSVLARFAATYPQVELSLADGYSSTFIDGVGDGSLDLAVINKPNRRLGLMMEPLLDEEMVVVGGSATPLPIPMPVRTRDLVGLDLVLPSARHGLRLELDRRVGAEDITLSPQIELDLPSAIADFVARSNRFTVLPSIAVSRQLVEGSLKAYRIVAPRITRQLVIIHHPKYPLTPAAMRFVEILGEELSAAAAALQAHIVTGP
ncbi:LysR family transcriptional regulator [Methylobacterium platani]|uniref:LysR family transcriptional regulator n=2 Tax=Methylobacterium platani TaxID=427683 RepID=A0A179RWI2_9HYPH|nr:LysR family transcriptional regulator [Methylobacterium platani]KMO11683.1 LysR family transcriptional regulator [Methylobacterium platani JCM 14648]OAS13121.1 LysR family transcriptional regulator [Methylobacterium platani]